MRAHYDHKELHQASLSKPSLKVKVSMVLTHFESDSRLTVQNLVVCHSTYTEYVRGMPQYVYGVRNPEGSFACQTECFLTGSYQTSRQMLRIYPDLGTEIYQPGWGG